MTTVITIMLLLAVVNAVWILQAVLLLRKKAGK